MRLANRSVAIPCVILTIIIIVALFPLWLGRFYAIGDMRDVYLPIENFFHQQQTMGHLPAWFPYAAWGFPVIAAAQIGFFYPPLLLLRYLPIFVYLPIIIFIHSLALALGIFFFLKQLKLSPPAAILGALSFTLGGFATLHLTHLNIFLAMAYLPWQFAFFYHLSHRPWRLFYALPASLLISLPFLIGQIQIPLFITAASLSWYLFLSVKQSLAYKKIIIFILLITTGSLLISAAQVLPTLELAAQSTRASFSTFNVTRANQHSYPLYHLPTLLFPRFYNNDDHYWGKRLQIEYGFYWGTIPLLLIFLVIIFYFRRKLPPDILPASALPFFIWLFFLTFLLGLGSLSPFRLIGLEPSLWFFSAPARWLLLTSFSGSIIAAVGLDYCAKHPSLFRRFFKIVLFIILITVAITNLFLFVFDRLIIQALSSHLSSVHLTKIISLLHSAQTSSLSLISIYTYLPIIILALAVFLPLKKLAIYLTSFTILELIILFVTTTPILPWSEIISPPDTVSSLPAAVLTNQARLYSVRTGGDTGAYFTNPDSRANTTIRARQRQLLVPLTHTMYNLSGVEWSASLDLANQAALLDNLHANNNYIITDTALAAEMNIGAVLQANPDDSITTQPLVYKPRLELVKADNTGIALPYPTASPDSLDLDLSVDQSATLILRDSFYPGWQALIDNHPIPISPYFSIFRSINVPPGNHHITFKYRPRSLYLGIIISGLTLLVFLGIWLTRPFHRTRHRQSATL